MKLVYVRPEGGEGPSEELQALFTGGTEVFEAPADDQQTRVRSVEGEMRERGIDLYEIDTLLLYPREVQGLGCILRRNAISSGVLMEEPAQGTIQLGDANVKPLEVSRLPYNGKSRVFLIAVHPDEEIITYGAAGHIKNGDCVHVLSVTEPDRKGWESGIRRVYSEIIGLDDDQFTFARIPDTEVYANRERLAGVLGDVLDSYGPDSVILTPPGMNHDHNVALDVCRPVLASYGERRGGVNILLGDAIESDESFRPSMWQIIDGRFADHLMSLYAQTGSPQYVEQVENLSRRLPTGVSKLLSYYKARRRTSNDCNELLWDMKGEDMYVGAFGYQPVSLRIGRKSGKKLGYQIPSVTDLFDGRHLTR